MINPIHLRQALSLLLGEMLCERRSGFTISEVHSIAGHLAAAHDAHILALYHSEVRRGA